MLTRPASGWRCILLCTNRAPPGARRLPRIVTIVSAPVANSTSSSAPGHRPVLLAEAIAGLQPRPSGRYLDATFGGGGHTRALLDASAPDGIVVALDADQAAIDRAFALQQDPGIAQRLIPIHANFADLAVVARERRVTPLDGISLDLGLSSFQLDQPERGFAFRHEGPLDMRFDHERGAPASDLVNTLPERELADLIWRYGEEPGSRRIARAIVRERERAPIATTTQLAEIVAGALGGRRGRDIHPATRTFQALRIATNEELAALEAALAGALDVLAPGGRLAVIAFHSLEDRIVKRFIERESAECLCPQEVPVCVCGHRPRLQKITRRAVRPDAAEMDANPRARSAVLRVAERLADDLGGPTMGAGR
jgi:16S rRNA (cytosine1402-N4)-methyltransferase